MSRSALALIEIPTDPQALAEAVGLGMYSIDPATQAMGIVLEMIAPGEARMRMTVRGDMLNGHQTCHGGFLFTFADSAFAFACNARNQTTVAAGCTIDFLAPGFEGDVLIAHAQERSLAGRTGIYDVTVTNQDGKALALFRGRSHRIKGQVIGQSTEA
jgi:acyl-CoA thioesterase